ncbi:MAG TPA: phosphoethanolamine transferase, partial [Campylobacterales bacterium]|nr:phosphoethanolamine transferase [Campylobacterales bacterium]
LEYILAFTKFTETIATFSTVLEITIIPILIILPMSFLAFYSLKKMNEKRIKVPYLSLVLILFLIFIPLRVYLKDSSKKGARPNIEVSTIVNSIETLGFLFGRIVPQKVSGSSDSSQVVIPTPEVENIHPNVNVVVIMGESLTHTKMSLYGEKDKTTPLLDELSKEEAFTKQIAFTSGIVTDVALPSFFNILYQPDSTEQILSTNTCLFKMAKDNGFETYFYSPQSRVGLAYIKSYMCLNSVEHYLDGTHNTDEKKKNALDQVLVDRLDLVDFSKPSFIVLHQIGSHSPYGLRYPKEFNKFKSRGDRYDRGAYKNSILYTDYIVSEIIKKLKTKTDKPTYVFFTSDHGEGTDEHAGHGNLKLASNFEVPFILYLINDKEGYSPLSLKQKYTSHYEIAKLVGDRLGYDMTSMKQDMQTHYVCGKDLSGVAGCLSIMMKGDMILESKIK